MKNTIQLLYIIPSGKLITTVYNYKFSDSTELPD
jgi:hypothetical protein